MGRNLGRGRGGLAPEEQTGIGFQIKRGKVHTGKGAIIGEFQVDGEQSPGEVSADIVDIVSAAERDASDLINRDRIPRQYQKAVKEYFANVQRTLKDGDKKSPRQEAGSTGGEDEANPTGKERDD